MIFGWTPEHIMEMPACRFFALLESGRKIIFRMKANDNMNLCDVQSISLGNVEHYQNIRKGFYYKSIGREDIMERGSKALNPVDPFTVQTVQALFDTASRLN